MAVRPEAFTNPLLDVEGDPFAGVVNPYTSVNPAAQSGMEALRPGLADQAVGLQPPTEVSRFEMPSGLSTPPSGYGLPSLGDLEALQQQTPFEFLAATQAPQPQQQEQGLRLGYDSAAGKYLINNTVVDFRDIESLQRVPELVQEPLSPETPAGNWRPIDLQTLKRNKDELLNISIGERLRLGTQQVAGSIPRGAGRVFEFAGAEGLGEAFVGLGERLSPDEFDEARQAAVQQSQNIFQEIATGVPQGLPSVVASIGGGIAGGVAGGFITGGPGGAVIGGIIGGASTIFPMMVDSAYDTALRQQGEEFVKSPEGRVQILGTALATTGVQIVPGSIVAGRVVPTLMQRAGQQVAQKSVSSIPGEAAKVGFAEGIAEMMAVVIEQVAFDPETRAMMSEGEVAAMLPYVAETYGREAAVAFSVGAILGAPIGAVTAAATRPREEVPTAPEPESNLLVPTEDRPAAPEFTGEMRGVGPQGVLPIEGLGGQIERARRSRQVGYQPPRTGEQTNLLEKPAPVVDEAQLDIGFAEEVVLPEPARPSPLAAPLTRAFREREFDLAQDQRRTREEAAAEAQRQLQIVEDARLAEEPPALRQPGEAVPQQQPLFTRRQAPALSRGEQLRRGIQRVPELIPPAVEPAVPAPAQGQLFTRRGLPTVAARAETTQVEPGQLFGRVDGSPFRTEVSAVGQRRRVSRDTGVPVDELEVTQTDDGFFLRRRGEEVVREPVVEDVVTGVPEDAIQEPSPAAVPARERAEVSPEVGARVPSVAEPARAREEEIIQRAQEVRPADVREDVVSLEPASDAEYINDLIQTIESTRDKKEYVRSIADLIAWGQDADLDINLQRAGLDAEVFNYLNTLPIDSATQQAIVEFARFNGKPIQATYIRGARRGSLKPVFEFILRAQMFDSVRTRFGFTSLPTEYQPAPDTVVTDVETGEQIPNDLPQEKAESLANLIRDYNTREFAMNANDRQLAIEKLAKQYQAVQAEGLESFTDTYGEPLSNYFDEDGAPNAVVRDNRLRIITDQTAERSRITTPDMLEQWDVDAVTGEATVRPADRLRRRTEGTEEEALLRSMGMDGRFMTLDGEPISKPTGEKQVRMFLNTFKNKLKIKPRTFVYKNQADLQSRNPELYQRAVAARPQGDFDTKVAAGYSFGTGKDATVVIFSDRIVTRQQLNYVMAHETLGHFGFRGILPKTSVDSFMETIYQENGPESALAQEVDAAMAADSTLSRAEAVEEYLADYAAQLDVNLIARIFNFIKGALNRLGVQFADDSARYFVNQARRYVRNGEMSSLFSNSEVMRRIRELETGADPENTGRFAPTTTLRADNILASLMQDAIPMNLEGAQEWFKKQRVNVSGDWDTFKNKYFNLLVFRARENPGLSAVHDVVSQSRDIAMAVRREMQEKLAVVLDRAIVDRLSDVALLGGATEAEVDFVNKFLYEGLRYALSTFRPADLGSARLYSVDATGNVIANENEINRLFDLGTLDFEQMRDGFSYQITFEEAGETKTETINVEGIAGLTRESVEWRGYIAARETIRDVELKLLKARNIAYTQDRDYSFVEMSTVMKDGTMSPASRQFLDRMYNKYRELWTDGQIQDENGDLIYNPESIEQANRFLVALNTAIIARESSATDPIAAERNAAVAEFFPEIPAGNIDTAIEQLKDRLVPLEGDARFTVQNRLKDIIVADLSDSQADIATKTTIATGYVPLRRDGGFEVRIEAFDKQGNRVALRQEYRDQLAYRQFEDEGEAVSIASKMNEELFVDKTYEVEVFNRETQQLELQEVTLRAETGTVLDAPAAPPQLNLNEFIQGLRQFNIVLNPRKLQEVIVDLTRQNNRARKRLQRRLVPGFDPNALRAVAEHVESRASTVAKIIMRPKLAELTNLRLPETRKLWEGDKAKLDRLRTEWEATRDDPNANEAQRLYAKREYNRYAYMYNKTNPEGKAKRDKQYFNEASQLLQFIENNQDINESDFARGPVVSAIRASTSIMQLGGSVATGVLNYISIFTNTIPYLTNYNSSTAFGGGFSFGPVMQELHTAMNQVGLVKSVRDNRLNTAQFYDEIAGSEQLQEQYGLASHEANFIATEIREGTMIPAQMNMLTELALGRIRSAAARRVLEGYMYTFNATERGSRRSAGLTAYRLEYKRRRDAGFSEAQASEFARQFAVETLRATLGEYSVTNRPAAWRSGIQSFLYIYKVFPTTSIQMLSRLPRKGQAQMLGALLLLSGLSGLPFAQDLEDIIDTIAQRLGLGMGSVRKEVASLTDAILPGSSALFITGVMRSFLPGDIASRTSLGDFIPGTGVLLAGSSTTREVAEIAGPAWSMLSGVGTFINNSYKAATTEQVTLEDVLREAPVTGFRMLGDALAYGQSGAVVDRRGYVVSPDMHMGIIASRLLGFYPSSAAQQYEIIRVSRRLTDYQREVSAGFRYGWIKAKVRGDERQARAIEEAVRDWNRGAKGTALEIRNFKKNSIQALREAKRPALERLRKSAPQAARSDIERTADLLGY